ncbi:hypothetical protein G7Y89_g5421 [Cudoniella acicularis]|uniref:Uncharacterized protein n=1 Tax=Cudoniella acicularis TaxID=354080 RepID=A0A8H4RPP9_9HELO|nr:hypothetical protein G7Y89_g5421 [Cudoniella acicularis]
MITIRRSIPVLRNGCKALGVRSFHSTPHHEAKPRPSPRVSRTRGPTPQTTQPKKASDVEQSLPPLALLESASKSGLINISARKALEFLQHGVTPLTLTLLGAIIKKSPTKAQQTFARKLLYSASEQGEKTATFEIIIEAIQFGIVDHFQNFLKRLGLMVKNDNDPEAMMVLGKVLYSQGKNKKALEWFRKATQPPTGSLGINGAGDALVHEGRILLAMQNKKEAEIAFKKAALELDEPVGYFYLSQLQEPGSPKQEVYLIKAASSGSLEACHNLGAIHLARIKKEGKTPKSLDDYGMAREWFLSAASGGFGLSMLNLALLCRAVGQESEGLRWLNRAEEIPEVKRQALDLKSQWDSDRIKLS